MTSPNDTDGTSGPHQVRILCLFLLQSLQSTFLDHTTIDPPSINFIQGITQTRPTPIAMPSWDNKPSGTMTAMVLNSPGAEPPSKAFSLDTNYPKPTLPSEKWALVKVKAAGLNRAELRGRNGDKPAPPEFGIFKDEYHEDPPKILGEEFVGIVELAGSGTDFRRGDAVTGFIYGGGKAHDVSMSLLLPACSNTKG